MKVDIDYYLEKLQINSLNEMQLAAIEASNTHAEFILLSNTGSGKTIAFLLSALGFIDEQNTNTQTMIIVPSRELALQIDEVLRKMGTGLKVTVCYGGHKREIEEQNLIQSPTVIIGTTGRIADHIRRKNIDTNHIKTLVLDEFDKTLELGFLEELNQIISNLKHVENKILTSATQAVEIPSFINLQNPTTLNFIKEGKEASNFALEVFTLFSPEKDKVDTLFNFLCYANNRPTIIFCNHRDAVERVAQMISDKGIRTVYYHGGMEQRERESELCMFKNGTSNVLVTTDLASRGLDIEGIRYIVHYHLPSNQEVFTHRNGRTARMNDFGTSILLLSEEEHIPSYISGDIKDIELDESYPMPAKSEWNTLHFSLGKKDKINKIDVVGFLSQIANLKKDDIGLIEVKDFYGFVAVRKNKISEVLRLIMDRKMKGKKVRFGVATNLVK